MRSSKQVIRDMMLTIARAGALSINQLARKANVPHVSLIHKFVKSGHISLTAGTGCDKRIKTLTLTKSGRLLCKRLKL